MRQGVGKTEFHNAFDNADRLGDFTYRARELLFDYFMEIEARTGEEMELNVIAICEDYREMTADTVIKAYGVEVEDGATKDEKHDAVREYLEENTYLIGETPYAFVFQAFSKEIK